MDKLKTLERTGADLKRRMIEIRNRQEKLTLEKGQLALDHAVNNSVSITVQVPS